MITSYSAYQEAFKYVEADLFLSKMVDYDCRNMRTTRNRAHLIALSTRVPRHSASPDIFARFLGKVLEHDCPPGELEYWTAFLDRVVSQCGIRSRQSVLSDFARSNPEDFEFFPRRWDLEPFPTTAQRMAIYEEEALRLAHAVAREALESGGLEPSRVTHLVVCSCTGFFAPGIDIRLCELLHLSPDVSRTLIGFMGCYSGFTGMRQASEIIGGDSEAVVLQVCVELCSIHFQKKRVQDLFIANTLFGDGAAAALYSAGAAGGSELVELRASRSDLHLDSLDQMSWRIGDHGFEMRLSTLVPVTLRSRVRPFVDALLGDGNTDRSDVVGWAIHPGGRRIVDDLGGALELSDDDLRSSRNVLAEHGNMSSATIFFVLEDLLRAGRSGCVAALGFGPGLTVEGALLELRPRGSGPCRGEEL